MSNDMIPLDVTAPRDGQIKQLADDLFWFRFTLPFRLNHINLFALETAEGWLLLDCGINAESNATQWPAILAQLQAQTVARQRCIRPCHLLPLCLFGCCFVNVKQIRHDQIQSFGN